MSLYDSLRLAVLVPCYNEAVTVRSVVRDFRAALPGADIYVFDNNSTHNTGESKLNTYRDGFRILSMIVKLFRAERPLAFFSIGTVVCAALMIFAALFLVCGVILDTVTHGRAEVKRLAYLAFPAPDAPRKAIATTTVAPATPVTGRIIG